jgi:formate hydrogenlyase transcriptional activator
MVTPETHLKVLALSDVESGGKPSSSGVVGSSPKFRTVIENVQLVAPADCSVLIHGETGTGKEVVAQAIHDASRRRQQRFVAINCAAIPGTLVESELFGHERGAFTGALHQRVGRLEAADRGTIFLDEIGDLPLELQPKLLRALQQQEFERLGSSRTTRVDVRVIAATNQDLWGMVKRRRFRADLFYRLNVFALTLPPLREREGDIPLLVAHFVRTFAERQGKSIPLIPDHVLRALERYTWPGNIRELQNFIERSVILTRGPELQAPVAELLKTESACAAPRTLAEADRAHIMAILKETNWVVGGVNGAAARLGLKRTTLIAKMHKLGVSRETAEEPVSRDGHSHGNRDPERDPEAERPRGLNEVYSLANSG